MKQAFRYLCCLSHRPLPSSLGHFPGRPEKCDTRGQRSVSGASLASPAGPVVGPSSVRCLSRGRISKTKQETPVVAVEHCVGIADSDVLWVILISNSSNISTAYCSTWCQTGIVTSDRLGI